MLLAFMLVLLWLAIDDARNHGRYGAARMTPVRIALPPRGRR
jgi:hypothetical protein